MINGAGVSGLRSCILGKGWSKEGLPQEHCRDGKKLLRGHCCPGAGAATS